MEIIFFMKIKKARCLQSWTTTKYGKHICFTIHVIQRKPKLIYYNLIDYYRL